MKHYIKGTVPQYSDRFIGSYFGQELSSRFPGPYYGMEIEVENITGYSSRWKEYFIFKEDGSLRNGIELVTAPIQKEQVLKAIDYFYTNFPTTSKETHFSFRTSIHFHLNVMQWNLEKVVDLVRIYLVFEKLLYSWVGKDRGLSVFCVPLYLSQVPYLINIGVQQFKSIGHEDYRYLGLNLASIYKFGTVEFRHLGGTKDKQKVIDWFNIVNAMYMYVNDTASGFIVDKVLSINNIEDYKSLAYEIFGHELTYKLFQNRRNMLFEFVEPSLFAAKYACLIKQKENISNEDYKKMSDTLKVTSVPEKGLSFILNQAEPLSYTEEEEEEH